MLAKLINFQALLQSFCLFLQKIAYFQRNFKIFYKIWQFPMFSNLNLNKFSIDQKLPLSQCTYRIDTQRRCDEMHVQLGYRSVWGKKRGKYRQVAYACFFFYSRLEHFYNCGITRMNVCVFFFIFLSFTRISVCCVRARRCWLVSAVCARSGSYVFFIIIWIFFPKNFAL